MYSPHIRTAEAPTSPSVQVTETFLIFFYLLLLPYLLLLYKRLPLNIETKAIIYYVLDFMVRNLSGGWRAWLVTALLYPEPPPGRLEDGGHSASSASSLKAWVPPSGTASHSAHLWTTVCGWASSQHGGPGAPGLQTPVFQEAGCVTSHGLASKPDRAISVTFCQWDCHKLWYGFLNWHPKDVLPWSTGPVSMMRYQSYDCVILSDTADTQIGSLIQSDDPLKAERLL